MITRRPDHALVGKNYLSALLALDLLEKGRKVFLLDDGRIALGKFYCDYVNHTEYAFLDRWGRERDFAPSLARYAAIEEVNFYLGGDLVLLGRLPGENLRELLRRFPQIFGGRKKSESLYRYMGGNYPFDEELFSYMERLGGMFFRWLDPRKMDFPSLLAMAPKSLADIFHRVSAAYPSAVATPSGQLFFFSLRSFYQNVLDYRMDERELFDLLLNMLSPNMKLRTAAFEDELVRLFCARGGMYKSTEVREWAFWGRTLWGMELASYEGLTRPGSLTFVGQPPSDVPLPQRGEGESYTAIRIEVPVGRVTRDGVYVFSDIRSLGTSWPLLLMEAREGRASFYLPFSCRKKAKVEFFRDVIARRIGTELAGRLPSLRLDLDGAGLEFSSDIWTTGGKGHPLCVGKGRLKNIFCYGPSVQGEEGLMDSMIEIRKRSRHL